jgi:hypothetical protein
MVKSTKGNEEEKKRGKRRNEELKSQYVISKRGEIRSFLYPAIFSH